MVELRHELKKRTRDEDDLEGAFDTPLALKGGDVGYDTTFQIVK
jgi:hypothetical protein